jgi:putative ABC transport system permease protein
LGQEQEIVGVVGDIALSTLSGHSRATIYLPYAQLSIGSLTFVVRTSLEPTSLARAVRAAVGEVDPSQPVSDIQTLEDVVSASLTRPRVASAALGIFAVAALLLSAIGVYGVVAYGVQFRRREFGVRLALGAQPRDVLWLVVRQSMWLVSAGALLGLALAIPLSRALRSLLFGVAPGDPGTLAIVTVVMVGAGFLASYLPARRGTRVDPVETLRVG